MAAIKTGARSQRNSLRMALAAGTAVGMGASVTRISRLDNIREGYRTTLGLFVKQILTEMKRNVWVGGLCMPGRQL